MFQPSRNLRSDTRPLYVQAVDALYELLGKGAYAAGQLLPAETALALHLGVSRSTIREALGQLEREGLIVRKQGVGTFVAPRSAQISGGLERLASFRSVAEAAGATVQVLARTVDVVSASPDLALVLQIPPGSDLAQVRVVEAVDGCQMAYLEGWIACGLVDLAQLSTAEGSLLEYLSEYSALPVAYSRSVVHALGSDARLAAQLGDAEGRAILHLAETVFSDANMPIAHFRNYFTTDCFNFTIVRRFIRTSRSVSQRLQEDSQHGTV